MTNKEAIEILHIAQSVVEWEYPMNCAVAFDMAIAALERQDAPDINVGDMIDRKKVNWKLTALVNEFEEILSHIREREVDDSVCGLCEYDGAYIGQSGDWCNECPGFEKDDCFKLSDECRKRWLESVDLPSAQPEHKTGKWIKLSPAEIYECSKCGKNVMTSDIEAYNFCHGCGADMRGEQDE